MDNDKDETEIIDGASDETFGDAPTTPLSPATPPDGSPPSAARESQPQTGPSERPNGAPMSYPQQPEQPGQARRDMPPAGASHAEVPPYPPYAPYPSAAPSYQGYPAQPPYPGPQGRRPSERRTPGWVKATAGCLIAFAVVIAFCALASGIVGGLALASVTVSGRQSQTLSISGTPHVVLDVQAGNVHVLTGQGGQVGITLSKSARALSSGLAQQALDATHFTATQSGDTITITSEHGSTSSQWPIFWRNFDLSVTVPQTTNLTTTMQAGNLTVDGISGVLDLRARASNVELNEVTLTGNSSLRLTAGNLTLHGALADHVALDVAVTAGNVHLFLPASTSASVFATVTAGDVSVVGFAVGNSSSGRALDVDLNPSPTSKITIAVTRGNASVMAE
jgi:putative adhesin